MAQRIIARRPPGWRNLRLTSRLLAVSGVLLVLFGGAFAAVLWLVRDVRTASRHVRASNRRIEAANRIFALVVDLQTGVRGYIVTHDARFLAPYDHGLDVLPAAERNVLETTAGDSQQTMAARRIVGGVEEYRSWQTAQALRAQRDPGDAARVLATGEGRRRVEILRRQVGTLVERERVVLARGRSDLDESASRAVAFTVVGLLGIPLVLLALVAAAARRVVAPIRRVAIAAERVQGGDLGARVKESGPGEVRTLARSFNAMAEAIKQGHDDLESHNAELEAQGAELARAVEELGREKERVEAFHSFVVGLAGESELQRLLPHVLDALRAAAGADVGAIYAVDPVAPERGLELSAVAGLDRRHLPERLTPAAGLPARAAAERRPVGASHEDARLCVEDVAVRHELHLPLVYGEQALGVVTVAKAVEPALADVDVLGRMADAAAVALSNALALETARHRADVNRAVLETANDAYVAVDADLRVTGWTSQAEALFGYTEEEALGVAVDELLVPERWRPGYRSEHERLLRGGATRRFDLPARHRDGRRLRVEWSASPLRVGGRWQVNGFVRDISERVAREQGREMQRAVSQALAETPAGEDVVPALLEALGRSLHWPVAIHWLPDAAAGGMRCGAAWLAPELDDGRLERELRAGTAGTAAATQAQDAGRPRWAPLAGDAATPFAAAARRIGLGGAVAVPVSRGLGVLELWQRRSTAPEAELLESLHAISGLVAQVLERRRAEVEAKRLKDEFFALVSHELRTPLTSIIGYLELLIEEEAGHVSPTQSRFLGVVERNARRLERLVDDLLFVAQVEAGTLTLERGPVDLEAVVRDAVEAARPRAQRAGVELTEATGDVPALAGDPDRLGQVVDNLISNALKFTPAGGSVAVRAGGRDGRAVIAVADTGMGIAAAEQERLFERFYRTTSASERSIPGIGLGLSICRAIAEGHGGAITVDSREGHGTTFTVELPVAAAPANPSTIERVHQR